MPEFVGCISFISGTTNGQGQLMKDLLPTQNCGLKCSGLGEDMPDRITSAHPDFPLSVDPYEIFGPKFENPKPPPSDNKRFWILCVPLGFVIGLVGSVLAGANIWLPLWGISAFVLWAAGLGKGSHEN
jgi:hypothetical protein